MLGQKTIIFLLFSCILGYVSAQSNTTSSSVAASESDPCAFINVKDDYSYPLHIGSVFIILVASFVGAIIPILSKHATTKFHLSPFQISVGKCAGTGVVLACALVHMLQPANESLTSECLPKAFNTDYGAYAFLYCMLAGLVMQFLDYSIMQYFIYLAGEKGTGKEEYLEDGKVLAVSTSEPSTPIHSHVHGGFFLLEVGMQKTISAYLLEFGVTVHSVFIGLTVGVATNSDVHALLVALFFHQFFEGVALGARIADSSNISRVNEFVLCLIFSVAAPFGIALGIGIVSSLNVGGETFLLVQGTFDGICAGILLYIGYSLLLKDFPEDMERYCKGPHSKYKRAAMFISLWLGAGLMAFIGKYL